MCTTTWKVGELARFLGISVRTLHHYDDIGLLKASKRTRAGHRLYTQRDVMRLQQITLLKTLEFSLEEIKNALDYPEFSPQKILTHHLQRVKHEIQEKEKLYQQLAFIVDRLKDTEQLSTEDFFLTIKVMKMTDQIKKYYTPKQLETLKKRRESLGEERIKEVEAEWPRLMKEVQTEMEKGTSPSDPKVQALAKRWMTLVREFTGNNPGISRSLGNVWKQEEQVHGINTGHMKKLMEYIAKANANTDKKS